MRVVVGIAVRRLLVPWEAVGCAAATAAERVGHIRQLHVGRRLRRRVRLHVGESGGVQARMLRTVLHTREATVACIGTAGGAGGRRGRQSEPVGGGVRRDVALHAATAVRVLRPRLRRRRGRLARRCVRQRPYLRLGRRDWYATVSRPSLCLLLYPVAQHLVVHPLQHLVALPLIICKDNRIDRSYFTSARPINARV